MRKIRTLLGAFVAGACALTVLPGVALAAPTAPYTVLTVDVGDAYGKPVKQSGVHDGTNSTVTGRAYGTGGVSMGVSGLPGGSTIAMWITPPVGQSFTAGQTYQTSGSGNSTHAGLDMSSDSTACNGAYSYGSLTVREIAYDAGTGAATAFAAAYEFHCSPNAGAVTGELRWNSNLAYVGVTSFPTPVVDFGRVAIDGTVPTATVTFTVKGTLPSTFDVARISGANPSSFSIVSNGCSGRTFTPGNFCRVTLAPKALRWGDYTANLELVDNSAYGKRVVPLKFTAYDTVIGMYYPLAPQRLMDTRTGLGVVEPGPLGTGSVNLQVAGRGGVPASGVGSVVLNVTVTGPTANSFLTLYPYPEATPTASSINFPAGWLGSNNVTVKVGAEGKVSIYNRSGTTHVVVDVVGFYAASDTVKSSLGWGGQYQSVEPTRLIDTRPTGLVAKSSIDSYVDFGPSSPHVKALVLNITAVKPVKSGFLSASSGDGPALTTSTVNYGAGKVVPNLAFVRTGKCTNCNNLPYAVPTFSIYTSEATNMVVDLVGVIDDGSLPDGLRFTPLSPTRIADSRSGLGTSGALGAGETRKITAPSTVVAATTEALAMNVTAVAPTKDTVITVWPADADMAKPGASNLNPAAGQIVSNAVMGGIGPQDAFNVHNLTGSLDLVADVVGRFYLYSGTASTTALAGGQPLTVRGTGAPD
ncbi:hypothetical protein [Micromonospora sp. NPDC050200]|uniref:hypothetical protein n=1 Tax=Micromonospora sp. NPDC050200 TaxID=3155664 RepID=UPI0033E49505